MIHTRKTCALFALALTSLPATTVFAAPSTAPKAETSVAAQPLKLKATRAMTRRSASAAKSKSATAFTLPATNSHRPKSQPVIAQQSSAARLRYAANEGALRPIPLMPAFDAPPPAASTKAVRAAVGNPMNEDQSLHSGESEILDFDGITTTAVGDPTIADIVPLSTRRLLVNAKSPGTTTIFVFDSRGKNTITVHVTPGSNFAPIADRIEKDINISTVTVRAVNDTIFLEGSVPSQSDADLAVAIATAYTPKVKSLLVTPEQPHIASLAEKYAQILNDNLSSSGINASVVDTTTISLAGKYALPIGSYSTNTDVGTLVDAGNQAQTTAGPDPLTRLLKSLPPELKIINLIDFHKDAARQILVRAKIIDINRSSTKQLGFDWGSVNYGETQVGTTQTTVPTAIFQSQPILFAQSPGAPSNNLLGGGGPLGRTLPFAVQLQALIQENKARILSQPSLLVLDGNQANMLVGGEFPIPVSQGGGGGQSITVTFKPFGVRLNVAPTIVGDDMVQLTVTPEVSDIDFANAVSYNGGTIPGITVRRATSTLQMKDGETLVIGGLYSTNYSNVVKKIPFLSNIPVLGEFFKSTQKTKIERELLVLLETEIVKPTTDGVKPPAPGSAENMNIPKPFVPRKEFDQDFPDIQNFPHKKDPETPKVPISLPATSPESAGK